MIDFLFQTGISNAFFALVGGKVQVVIPQTVLEENDDDSWQWVLAHELAHVQRRDYLVRWLEWFACACFWWNPVVWWAQRNLRASEELCCDALVLSRLNPDCRSYADSILKTVESLVCPVLRPPAMASEINSGGYLERRFVMIMSGNVLEKSSRFIQVCVLALALVVFPLGLVNGQDFEKVEKRLQKLVEKDHLSQEQANAMMGTLKRMEQQRSDRATDRGDTRGDRDSGDVRDREAYDRAVAEMETMVVEGKIKREDMEKRLAGIKKNLSEKQERVGEVRKSLTREQYGLAAEKMKQRVAEGKAKKEDVEKRLAEMRKLIADPRGEGSSKTSNGAANARADRYRAISEKLRAAVESGEMTTVDAREKLTALRYEMAKGDQEKTERASLGQVSNLEGIARRLKLAVESGDMTKEEANAKLKELTAEIEARDREKKADPNSDAKEKVAIDEIAKKIRQAVADGQITKEEAAAKMKALKEEVKQKKEAEANKKNDGENGR